MSPQDESSEEESGYFTPSNSPIINTSLPQLTDDEESDDESEDDDEEADMESAHPGVLAELPMLLSYSEDEDEDAGPVRGPGNNILNSVFARPTPVDEGLAPPAYPGAWVGYSEYVSEEDDAAMLQDIFEHFDRLKALEAEATARTSTPH